MRTTQLSTIQPTGLWEIINHHCFKPLSVMLVCYTAETPKPYEYFFFFLRLISAQNTSASYFVIPRKSEIFPALHQFVIPQGDGCFNSPLSLILNLAFKSSFEELTKFFIIWYCTTPIFPDYKVKTRVVC